MLGSVFFQDTRCPRPLHRRSRSQAGPQSNVTDESRIGSDPRFAGWAGNEAGGATACYGSRTLAHITRNQAQLLNRVRRIRGQVDGIERVLNSKEEEQCGEVLQIIAACRGALTSLMVELIEGHIRFHIVDPRRTKSPQARAAQELVDILSRYLK